MCRFGRCQYDEESWTQRHWISCIEGGLLGASLQDSHHAMTVWIMHKCMHVCYTVGPFFNMFNHIVHIINYNITKASTGNIIAKNTFERSKKCKMSKLSFCSWVGNLAAHDENSKNIEISANDSDGRKDVPSSLRKKISKVHTGKSPALPCPHRVIGS